MSCPGSSHHPQGGCGVLCQGFQIKDPHLNRRGGWRGYSRPYYTNKRGFRQRNSSSRARYYLCADHQGPSHNHPPRDHLNDQPCPSSSLINHQNPEHRFCSNPMLRPPEQRSGALANQQMSQQRSGSSVNHQNPEHRYCSNVVHQTVEQRTGSSANQQITGQRNGSPVNQYRIDQLSGSLMNQQINEQQSSSAGHQMHQSWQQPLAPQLAADPQSYSSQQLPERRQSSIEKSPQGSRALWNASTSSSGSRVHFTWPFEPNELIGYPENHNMSWIGRSVIHLGKELGSKKTPLILSKTAEDLIAADLNREHLEKNQKFPLLEAGSYVKPLAVSLHQRFTRNSAI